MSPVRLLEIDGFVRLRWWLTAVEAALVALAVASGDGPAIPLFALVAATAASNLALSVRGDDRALLAVVGLDSALLTGLYAWTGGASNPFALGYLLHVALAAMALSPRAAWAITVIDAAAYGSLFLVDDDGPHAAHMRGHLVGMWLAYAVGAPFVNVLVARVRSTLAEADRRLAAATALQARTERLTSLATLAAGAAHELGTPLSTIAVVAKELERAGDAAVADDARLVRSQVERCREILLELSGDAGAGTGEAAEAVTVGELVRSALREHPGVDLTVPAEPVEARLPVRLLGQAIRRLVDNARDADPEGPVRVEASVAGDRLVVAVRDHGPGLSADALLRAGEPFFTTKPPGKGMGLGLFFARSVATQLGGELSLDSGDGATTARLVLPLRAP